MDITIIKTEEQYDKALVRLKEIFDAKPNTPQGDEFELLSLVLEKYEEEHFAIPNPEPLEAIRFAMEQQGYTDNDLGKILNSRPRVTEIFSKQRKLSLEQIRKINKELHIPAEVLIQAY